MTGVVFQYLELNGNGGGNGGGGGIQLGSYGAGGAGPTIQYNWIHGMQSSAPYQSGGTWYGGGTDDNADNGIVVTTSLAQNTSNLSSATWNNLTIQFNRFGAGTYNSANPGQGDCNNNNMMQTYYYPYVNSPSQNGSLNGEYNNIGGYCNAIGLAANTSNLTITNNSVFHLEQGFKFYEPGGSGANGQDGCNSTGLSASPGQYCNSNSNVAYNDFTNIHRIAIEHQQTANTVMSFDYNDWHDCLNCGYGSWQYSLPASQQSYSCSGAQCTNSTNADYNVIVSNVNPPTLYGKGGGNTPGFEFWGTGHENYNLGQGNISCVIHYGYVQGAATYNFNAYQGTNGQVACNEEGSPPPVPNTGNTNSSTTAALTSALPTLSPASGPFTGSQLVTITNPGTNRDVNTIDWCTTDGSTPVPGSGTAKWYYNGGTFTVTSTTTVKCVGMWGGIAQPTSYASGYGYVPSSTASATYTSGGPPTLTSCSQTNVGSVSTINVGGTIQQSASCYYASVPTTTNCTTADAYGNAVTAWGPVSSPIISVGQIGSAHPGLVTGLSAGTAASTATVTGGVSCANYNWTVNNLTPTLNSAAMVIQSGGSSVPVGGTVQMCVNLAYVSPAENTQVCGSGTDAYGTVVNTYTSSVPADATIVSSAGVLTGVAAGSTTVQASVNSGAFTPSLGVSVVAPSVTPAALIQGAAILLGNGLIQ